MEEMEELTINHQN